MLVLNAAFSLFKVFQFEINMYSKSLSPDYPFDGYGINYCKIEDKFVQFMPRSFQIKCQLFTALNMINNIFNNMLFLFISVVIDVGLIRFTNQNLDRKKRLFASGDTPELNQATLSRWAYSSLFS